MPKITFIFTYKNGFEQMCTFASDSLDVEFYSQLAESLHKNMMSDLGAVAKLTCREGLICVRLSEVINLVVKGL